MGYPPNPMLHPRVRGYPMTRGRLNGLGGYPYDSPATQWGPYASRQAPRCCMDPVNESLKSAIPMVYRGRKSLGSRNHSKDAVQLLPWQFPLCNLLGFYLRLGGVWIHN